VWEQVRSENKFLQKLSQKGGAWTFTLCLKASRSSCCRLNLYSARHHKFHEVQCYQGSPAPRRFPSGRAHLRPPAAPLERRSPASISSASFFFPPPRRRPRLLHWWGSGLEIRRARTPLLRLIKVRSFSAWSRLVPATSRTSVPLRPVRLAAVEGEATRGNGRCVVPPFLIRRFPV
jgi:hypothetical protein